LPIEDRHHRSDDGNAEVAAGSVVVLSALAIGLSPLGCESARVSPIRMILHVSSPRPETHFESWRISDVAELYGFSLKGLHRVEIMERRRFALS
jgi:hypothetical protein